MRLNFVYRIDKENETNTNIKTNFAAHDCKWCDWCNLKFKIRWLVWTVYKCVYAHVFDQWIANGNRTKYMRVLILFFLKAKSKRKTKPMKRKFSSMLKQKHMKQFCWSHVYNIYYISIFSMSKIVHRIEFKNAHILCTPFW